MKQANVSCSQLLTEMYQRYKDIQPCLIISERTDLAMVMNHSHTSLATPYSRQETSSNPPFQTGDILSELPFLWMAQPQNPKAGCKGWVRERGQSHNWGSIPNRPHKEEFLGDKKCTFCECTYTSPALRYYSAPVAHWAKIRGISETQCKAISLQAKYITLVMVSQVLLWYRWSSANPCTKVPKRPTLRSFKREKL